MRLHQATLRREVRSWCVRPMCRTVSARIIAGRDGGDLAAPCPDRPRRSARLLLLGAGLLVVLARAAGAQESSDCLECHSDKTLTKRRAGKTVSLFVDEKRLAKSVHADAPCVGCHSASRERAPARGEGRGADCDDCHGEIATMYAESLHGKAAVKGDATAPRCWSCHGGHDIVKVKDPRSPVLPQKVPFLCGRCHREGRRSSSSMTSRRTGSSRTTPSRSTAKAF